MKRFQTIIACLLSCFLTGALCADTVNEPAPAGGFPVRSGDVWVMLGDSITAQKLHTTYLEAFIRARYPQLKFAVINSGKNGDTFVRAVIRLRRDVIAFKPTLVSVELGMNDHRFLILHQQDVVPPLTLQRVADTVKNAGARMLVFSPSPYNRPSSWGAGPRFDAFVGDLKDFAGRNNAPFIDQYDPLKAIWSANFARDRAAALRAAVVPFLDAPFTDDRNGTTASVQFLLAVKPFLDEAAFIKVTDAPAGTRPVDWLDVPDKETLLAKFQAAQLDVKGREDLRRYLKETWLPLLDQQRPPPVTMGGAKAATDIVHPGPAGQWIMAALLFRGMGGEGLVSSVDIDAGAAKLLGAEKAQVRDIMFRDGVLRFRRLDESLPLPVPPEVRGVLSINVKTAAGTPAEAFGMSRYLLTVRNLPVRRYELLIADVPVAVVEARELAAGLDVGLLDRGPAAKQAGALLEAVTRGVVVAGGAVEGVSGVSASLPESVPQEQMWTLRPLKDRE